MSKSQRPAQEPYEMRVLVVEDEVRLATNVAEGVREGLGYAVDIAYDGEDAVRCCATADYDALILDLMLPKKGGEEVVRVLRANRKSTPILILTAIDSVRSKIDLLNLGADDYLSKPFDLGELLARTKALVRRGKGAAQPVLEFAGIVLRTNEQSVTFEGREADLSPTEYRILEYLMFRPRFIVSKRELLEHLYDFTWKHHSNVIEAHVSNLRKKLRVLANAELVETLRGRGYRLLSAP